MWLCIDLQWRQDSKEACQQSVKFSGISDFPNTLLITQLINRTVNGTRLRQVSILIETQLNTCPEDRDCSATYSTLMFETSAIDVTASRNFNNYQPFGKVFVISVAKTRINQTIDVTFDTNNNSSTSFYLGILVDSSTSDLDVSRIIVFYHFCPDQTVDLIHHPQTPAIRSESETELSSVLVNASCVDNAEPDNGQNPVLLCSSGGAYNWSVVSGSGCHCAAGYIEHNGICESE